MAIGAGRRSGVTFSERIHFDGRDQDPHRRGSRHRSEDTFAPLYTSAAAHAESTPKVMVEGDGVFVRDDTSKTYSDAMAGLWCVNAGYGRDEIADAISDQARRLPYYHTFASMSNEPAARLADRLISLSPGRMSKVFPGSSGSDTNDTQVKIVWYYYNVLGKPTKKKIIARQRGYHGSTLAGASLSGMPHMHDPPLRSAARSVYPCRLPPLLAKRAGRIRRSTGSVSTSSSPSSAQRFFISRSSSARA